MLASCMAELPQLKSATENMDAWSVGQPQPASAIVGASISDLQIPV